MLIQQKTKLLSAFLLVLALALTITPTRFVLSQDIEYYIESVRLTVYRDGLVHVNQILVINETVPSVEIPLLIKSVENLLVTDENNTVVDYEVSGSDIVVFSLGATNAIIDYDTISLTTKKSEVWTLILNTSYHLTVYLPEGSTIVYLSDVPTSINTDDGMINLALFPAEWEISYVLPISPNAAFKVTDLSLYPEQIQIGNELSISALVTNMGEKEGSYTLVLRINDVAEDAETVTLAGGASTTVEFRIIGEKVGLYIVEISGLTDQFIVEEKTLPFTVPIEYVIIAAIAVIFVVSLWFFFRKRKSSVKKMLEDYPDLREEDRNVTLFIAERGGKVFESELRERFQDLPRTSLWRLVRRLESMEIVTVEKIGLQNQVKIRKR